MAAEGLHGRRQQQQGQEPLPREPPARADGRHQRPALGTRQRPQAAPAVELPHGQEVEQVQPGGELRHRRHHRAARGQEDRISEERCAQAPDRSGQADAGVLGRGLHGLAEADEGAEAGHEHGSGGGDPEAAQRGHVPHLVDVHREHDAEREAPAPERPVHADGDRHRDERPHLGEAEEEELHLGQDEHERDLELPQDEAEHGQAGAGPGRRATRRRGDGQGLADRPAQRGDALAHHSRLLARRRQQLERASPGGERAGVVAGSGGLLGFAGERGQEGGMDETMTSGTGEQRGSDLATALRAGGNGQRCRRRGARHRAGRAKVGPTPGDRAPSPPGAPAGSSSRPRRARWQ